MEFLNPNEIKKKLSAEYLGAYRKPYMAFLSLHTCVGLFLS